MPERPEAQARRPAQRAPYGLSFTIEELNSVQYWADHSDFKLAIILDQVCDGVEFEELLVLTEISSRRRSVTLWRTASNIIVQAPHARPHAFRTVRDALSSIRVKPLVRSGRRWF